MKRIDIAWRASLVAVVPVILFVASGLCGQSVGRVRAAAQSGERNATRSQIGKVLQDQAAAWNAGDIEGYMQGYWNSEELLFVGSSGVTRGWQATLERYKVRYPNRAAMGKLKFVVDELTELGPDAAAVLGTWELVREKDRPGGVFTLVLRRFPEGWKIVMDHTSVVEAKQ